MLVRGNKHANLLGKLLLSGALVAVSVAYGWWERQDARGAATAAAPMPPAESAPNQSTSTATTRAETTTPTPQETMTAAPAAPKTDAMAKPLLQSAEQTPASPALPLTALASLPMYQPPPAQTPLPLITGTPDPGAAPSIPAGTHLEDGVYLSELAQFEWGDLQVRITVQGGEIRGAQLVQYPDHRADSLEISQRASPLLNSELIRTQQAKVDIVSSATETSYVFRDAAASAIAKATRSP